MATKNSTEASSNSSDQSHASMVSLGLIIGVSSAALLLVSSLILLFWYRRSKGRWPCFHHASSETTVNESTTGSNFPASLAVKTVTEDSTTTTTTTKKSKQQLQAEQHKSVLYEHDKLDTFQHQIKDHHCHPTSPLSNSMKKKRCSRQLGTSSSSIKNCKTPTDMDTAAATEEEVASKPSMGMEKGFSDHVNFSDVTRNLRLSSSFQLSDDCKSSNTAATMKTRQQQQQGSPERQTVAAPRLRSKPSDTSDYVSDLDSCKPSRADTFSQVRENYNSASTVLSFQEVVRQLEKSGRSMQRQTSSSLVNVSRFCDYEDMLASTGGHEQQRVLFRPSVPLPNYKLMYHQNIYDRKYDSDGGANFIMYTQYNNRSSSPRHARKTKSEETGLNVARKSQRNTKRRNNKTRRANVKKPMGGRTTSSVKLPISRTLIELPIYSQATWAGPGHKMRHHGRRHLLEWNQGSEPHLVALNHNKSTHFGFGTPPHSSYGLSESGPYTCAQYKSLPIDISHLPKELVDKIGGQADRLLEPIEQLDFAHLCRPLPHRARPRESSKRLVSEKLCLPPGHSDLEVLSGTYEDQDTGLVSTDL